jgi:hypothetical protein
VPRSLPVEWVVAECAAVLGDRVRYSVGAGADFLAGIDRGVVFVFHNSGTPRLALARLVGLMAAADPGGRLSLSLAGIAGARGLLSRPEFAGTYRRLGLVAWVRGGQVTAVTPVTGWSDEVWAAHTRALLAEGS